MTTVSAFDRKSWIGRRAQLVRIARRAQSNYDASILRYQDMASALRPSQSCIDEAAASVRHHQARYEALVEALSAATALPAYSVRNALSRKDVSKLMTTNL